MAPQANFREIMNFYAPGLKRWRTSEWEPAGGRRFLPVSVTGSACALTCDHCGGRMLDSMISRAPGESLYQTASRLAARGARGLLISGGSNRAGLVPLWPHLDQIARIRSELDMKVVVHCGVATPRLAAGLAAAGADGVMTDIIGADETLTDVYHLRLTVADVEESLRLLTGEGLAVIPHIVLGLHYGRLLGEPAALELIARYPVAALVLVALTPLTGTAMAGLPPLPPELVAAFFARARLALPATPVNLGCARPAGPHKAELDRAAVDLGLNGIAYPADGVIGYARSRGLTPRLFENCCSLTWLPAEPTPFHRLEVT